jgi:hypothetical protein
MQDNQRYLESRLGLRCTTGVNSEAQMGVQRQVMLTEGERTD